MNSGLTSELLVVSALLFSIGLGGLLLRRSLLFMLVSVEIMMSAAGLAFITGSAHQGTLDGHVMFLFILCIAGAEVAVGLALILQLRQVTQSLNADDMDQLGDVTEGEEHG